MESLRKIDIPIKSTQELRNILQNGGMLMVDLDDTVKEASGYMWADGIRRIILPETVDAFRIIHAAGVPLGIATEQSFSEIEPFIADVAKITLGRDNVDPYELFNGLVIGEGGSIIRRPARNGQAATSLVNVVPRKAMEDREKLLNWLEDSLPVTDFGNWRTLPDVNPELATYVRLPSDSDQGLATISLWEKGSHITQEPKFIEKYKMIEVRINQVMQDLGITTLKAYEAGNGTLRIVTRTASKAHAVELLAAFGAIDRSKIVYACDGPNDLALAQQLKKNGGSIIAVGNAVPELHMLADFSATLPAGKGFAEAIGAIFSHLN